MTGLVLFRCGQYQSAIPAFQEAQKRDKNTTNAIPEAFLAAIYESLSRKHLGEKVPDMTPLYQVAQEQAGLPNSKTEPMKGTRSAEAAPLTRWNLLRGDQERPEASEISLGQ